MGRLIWLLVIALVVWVFGSAAWKTVQTATHPQTVAHPEFECAGGRAACTPRGPHRVSTSRLSPSRQACYAHAVARLFAAA